MPTPAATKHPILLVATYDRAVAVLPSFNIVTTSTANVLNVVKLVVGGGLERGDRVDGSGRGKRE